MRQMLLRAVTLSVIAPLLFISAHAWSKPTTRTKSTSEAMSAVASKPLAEILPISQKIDELVQAGITEHKVKPNPRADHATFVRRVYLDIIGRIPSYDEADAFLKSRLRQKRSKLIDGLLDSEGYVSHHFNYWADLLRVQTELRRAPGSPYVNWLKASLRQNKPYNQFVKELITAEGYIWNNGAAGYYQRDLDMPLDNMSNTTQIFLGTRLVCAQCHDHPFDSWTQLDYYGMAGYTFGVRARREIETIQQLKRLFRRGDSKENMWTKRAARELADPLQYFVYEQRAELRLPDDYQYEDAEPNAVVKPRTAFGDEAEIATGQTRRDVYADWLVSPENPRFTMVIANRLWKKVMGVGLIEPVDDIKEEAQASNPELMALLITQMVDLNYNMKQFLRILYNTKTYQRTATRKEWTRGEAYYFPGPTLRRLSAEQIWDSLLTLEVPDLDQRKGSEVDRRPEQLRALETASAPELLAMARARGEQMRAEDELNKKRRALRKQMRAAREDNDKRRIQSLRMEAEALERRQVPAMSMGDSMEAPAERVDPRNDPRMDQRWEKFDPGLVRASEIRSPAPPGHFLRRFGQSDREVIDNASVEATVPQILSLLNGRLSRTMVNENSVLVRNVNSAKSTRNRLQIVFKSILSRKATASEMSVAVQEVKKSGGDQGFGNVLWALINTREFMFNR